MERVRFGLFEFDPATGDLRRQGTPVGLQSQPGKVLSILLEHAGEIVTREALRTSVWGVETFVDFDGGLNFCIAQIRSAFGGFGGIAALRQDYTEAWISVCGAG